MEILTDPAHLIANVVAPKAEEEVPAVTVPTVAEPEVIAKGKVAGEATEPATPEKVQEKTAPAK